MEKLTWQKSKIKLIFLVGIFFVSFFYYTKATYAASRTIPNDKSGIPDKVLYEQIVLSAGDKKSPLTETEAASVKTLTIPKEKIVESLKGLHFCKNIERLNLSCSMDTLKIADLKNLKYLNLSNASAKNLVLENLPKLYEINGFTSSYEITEKIESVKIKNLGALKSLYIELDTLKYAEISNLKNLRILKIAHQISNNSRLKAKIKSLPVLDELILFDISHIQIESIMNKLNSLVIRDSKQLELSTLKTSLKKMPFLTTIDIHESSLGKNLTIPNLYCLKELNIAKCDIQTISFPDSKLENIIISQTKLEHIEKTPFQKLKRLTISNSCIKEIDYTKATHLKKLVLYGNKLTSLCVDGMKNLVHIDVGKNKLKKIKLKNLNNLKYLIISRNQLKELDFQGDFKNLVVFDASYNKIKDIKQLHLPKFKNLEFLYINNNPFKSLSEISTLTKLRSLKLNSCNLTSKQIPKDFVKLENLESLDLAYNKITNLNSLKPLLEKNKDIDISLQHNKIKKLPSLKKCEFLGLDLGYNQISDLSGLNGNKFAGLSLNHNKITDLSSISNITILYSLNLSHNQIKDVTPLKKVHYEPRKILNEDGTYIIEKVWQLNLDYNKIDSLDDVMQLGTIGYYYPDTMDNNGVVYVSCFNNPCSINDDEY